MGFFSSKQAEDNNVYKVTVGLRGGRHGGNDKSLVQVIRSRFYGKRSREREDQQPPPTISFLGGVSAAQALSHNTNSTHASTSNRSGKSSLRSNLHPSTLFKKHSNDSLPSSSPSSSRPQTAPVSSTKVSSPLRKSITTDLVTVTLAQRLDELAAANSDGLLSDDEYRILRQNLFERFSSHSSTPSEAPIVPVASVRPVHKNGMQTSERPEPSRSSRSLSNFQINPSRPGSTDSRISSSSGVVSLFRRATSRRAVPKEPSDTSSIRSATSNNSNVFRLSRMLSKKSSNSSIFTNASRVPADTVSISSRQPDRSHGDNLTPVSIRHMATPPSSFPTRIIQNNRNNSIYNVFDEEHLKTVKEITQEIQNVEAEAKRLMDAFSGLEVTTLAKLQRRHIRPSLKTVDLRMSGSESHWSPDSESRSRRFILADDGISMRSGTSAGTTPSLSASLARSAYSPMKATRTKPLSFTSKAGSLHRKNSASSIASERTGGRTLSISISHGHLKGVNSSNNSLLRSTGHLPMDTVLEDEKVSMSTTVRLEAEDIEIEMEDIRRRREEVSLRYEARLEYLRAKLKGAQLHEKLMPTDDSESFILSTTPTPAPLRSFSQWSATDTPPHHHQGTSYYSQPPSPIFNRARRTTRSTSIGSSQATNRQRDDEIISEDDEDHSRRRGKAPESPDEDHSGEGDEEDIDEDDPITTVKDRQSLINVQHPFGLPIWKPALYKKSRTVTRLADEALHSIPSAQAERHLWPGNIFWALVFGWWLGLICIIISLFLHLVPQGDQHYSNLVYGLGWYLAWPFGKYLEGDINELEAKNNDEGAPNDTGISQPRQDDETELPKNPPLSQYPTITPETALNRGQNISWASEPARESTPLLGRQVFPVANKSYGTTVPPLSTSSRTVDGEAYYNESPKGNLIGKICFWLALVSIITPLMLFVCMICWFLVVTIPMAKLNWALIQYLFTKPTQIRFCAAPPVVIVSAADQQGGSRSEHERGQDNEPSVAQFSVKHPRLSAGQAAPSGSPTSTVLLCTYRAMGFKFFKYTVGGVNILFVNLLPIVFFVIFDGFLLLPLVEKMEHVPAFLGFIASKGLIFILCLTSVIPLSYFIGMAVASISAQSSIGMGAVINATFGSIIEIILYGMALMQGKGHLVEGSIVGSLLAGVLLMPGMSMCSGALRRKEQKFNAKSAGVTSMMLIMAIIGALTPTLFYQTYGNFQLVCSGCPAMPGRPGNVPWICDHCYYKHPDPVGDPFYQSTVKSLMYYCAAILLLSYLIGLWFSLRTHASQIWQNPQQLLHPMELPTHRISQYNKLNTTPGASLPASLGRRDSNANARGGDAPSWTETPLPRESSTSTSVPPQAGRSSNRKLSYASQPQQTSLRPVLESVDHAVKNANLQNLQLPESMTTDDFTRAVAVATVSALRHQQQAHSHSPGRVRSAAEPEGTGVGGHGGHDAPSWSRTTSASVLLACTALYAVIAELLVDVVDVILKDSGIQEKFLGITLFALVPNTTEFMNAISFALNGNIALSMEIGSAYALQVCLLQIPAMVAFSAWYDPVNMGESAKTFSLIFPRWDVIAIILSMFLMTYTYIEAKSNYHRGSILILSYFVLVAGFYLAPPTAVDVEQGHLNGVSSAFREFPALGWFQTARWYLQSLFQRGT